MGERAHDRLALADALEAGAGQRFGGQARPRPARASASHAVSSFGPRTAILLVALPIAVDALRAIDRLLGNHADARRAPIDAGGRHEGSNQLVAASSATRAGALAIWRGRGVARRRRSMLRLVPQADLKILDTV